VSCIVRARPPNGVSAIPALRTDADVLASFAEDAAHFPGGHASAVASPATEAELAAVFRQASSVLAIGAQSSLTGGATPMGDVLVTMSQMTGVIEMGSDCVRVQPGLTLTELDAVLRPRGLYYPPVPTFLGATVGGVVATNAAGAATFKYGTTRAWVTAITVMLASGDVIDCRRGETTAHPDGYFEIALRDRTVRIEIPRYRRPNVPEVSAGYFAAPGMDLVDLFVGSEGTLGIVTEVTLRVVPERPAMCLAWVPMTTRDAALALVETLHRAAQTTWRDRDPRGMDVSAIEHMDARCLTLLREDGADRQFGVVIPDDAAMALLVTLELPPATTSAQAFDEIGRFRDLDTPLARFCRTLDVAGVLDRTEVAVPGDTSRALQLLGVREAVPAAVNARVGRAKHDVDARIAKTAADMIVPFDRLREMLEIYDREFTGRGLDAAVWGHISDGNLHPNVIPRSMADVEAGYDAILACGREAIRLGGSPLAEHGVGRNSIKQALLRELYGEDGVDAMRRIKQSLDPEYKLAPGVIFPRVPRSTSSR